MKFVGFGLQIQQGRDIDSLGVDRLGVNPRRVVGQPRPVVVPFPYR